MSCRECAPYGLSSCPMCEPEPIECPDCKGYGYAECAAWDIRAQEEVEVTPETYICLPATKFDAVKKGDNFYRYFDFPCKRCSGTGYIRE